MLKPVYEGILNSYYNLAPVVTSANAGVAVKLDPTTAGQVQLVSSGSDTVFGLLAQDVRPFGVDDWKLSSVTLVAKPGDKVGVYTTAGHFLTDQIVGPVNQGDLLYVDPATSMLTATKPSGAARAIAQAETAGGAYPFVFAGVTTNLTRIFFFGAHQTSV